MAKYTVVDKEKKIVRKDIMVESTISVNELRAQIDILDGKITGLQAIKAEREAEINAINVELNK